MMECLHAGVWDALVIDGTEALSFAEELLEDLGDCLWVGNV